AGRWSPGSMPVFRPCSRSSLWRQFLMAVSRQQPCSLAPGAGVRRTGRSLKSALRNSWRRAEMRPRRSPGTIAAIAVAMGLGVFSCTVGPEYQRPPIALEAFHSAGAVAARSTGYPAPPLDAWWTGFDDPQLVRIVQRALDQNLDLAAALARVD